ncbi:hypothetical protein [Lacipirellula limnantheis]|uniref:Uncharacterized protein n=1 Tax=Lacipirellula limnantheis TaxID=2528024 RepID=A0A517TRF6_9BACT|nr:hypothetical protein [Lacipirellula limnantheis]QDT70963.1 hypothetical protein I41_01180 [Lacipirellula limnantheis]
MSEVTVCSAFCKASKIFDQADMAGLELTRKLRRESSPLASNKLKREKLQRFLVNSPPSEIAAIQNGLEQLQDSSQNPLEGFAAIAEPLKQLAGLVHNLRLTASRMELDEFLQASWRLHELGAEGRRLVSESRIDLFLALPSAPLTPHASVGAADRELRSPKLGAGDTFIPLAPEATGEASDPTTKSNAANYSSATSTSASEIKRTAAESACPAVPEATGEASDATTQINSSLCNTETSTAVRKFAGLSAESESPPRHCNWDGRDGEPSVSTGGSSPPNDFVGFTVGELAKEIRIHPDVVTDYAKKANVFQPGPKGKKYSVEHRDAILQCIANSGTDLRTKDRCRELLSSSEMRAGH